MTLLWKKIKPNNEKDASERVRFLRVYVSMLVIEGEDKGSGFYKILFEILLYILLLNYFLLYFWVILFFE